MAPSNHAGDSERGYIIPIGGAEEKFNNPEILDRFVEICGGKSARIAIIPTASELDDTGRNYEKLFRRLGVRHAQVLPFITRDDCKSPDIGIITAGSSIGAFNALAVLCRYPDAFTHAVCLSGTYDLNRFLRDEATDDWYFSSPLHFLPGLEGDLLQRLQTRFVLLASGEGEALLGALQVGIEREADFSVGPIKLGAADERGQAAVVVEPHAALEERNANDDGNRRRQDIDQKCFHVNRRREIFNSRSLGEVAPSRQCLP